MEAGTGGRHGGRHGDRHAARHAQVARAGVGVGVGVGVSRSASACVERKLERRLAASPTKMLPLLPHYRHTTTHELTRAHLLVALTRIGRRVGP